MEYRWWFSKLIIISLTRAVIFQWKAQRCFYLQMNFSLLFLTAVCIFIHRDTAHVYGCCNCQEKIVSIALALSQLPQD